MSVFKFLQPLKLLPKAQSLQWEGYTEPTLTQKRYEFLTISQSRKDNHLRIGRQYLHDLLLDATRPGEAIAFPHRI